MLVRQTIISEVDLKKLLKEKGIKSIRHLAQISGVEYTYLNKCAKDKSKRILSQESWNKIKFFI